LVIVHSTCLSWWIDRLSKPTRTQCALLNLSAEGSRSALLASDTELKTTGSTCTTSKEGPKTETLEKTASSSGLLRRLTGKSRLSFLVLSLSLGLCLTLAFSLSLSSGRLSGVWCSGVGGSKYFCYVGSGCAVDDFSSIYTRSADV
jgi:hypothetical protein